MLAPNPLYVNRRIAIEALRTTKLKQSYNPDEVHTGRYCALQVIALALGLTASDWVNAGDLIDPCNLGSGIYARNDGSYGYRRHSFAEIADYIESLV